MKTGSLWLAALALSLGMALPPAALAQEELASALEKVSQDQIAAFNREDVAATMGFAHTKSPDYDATRDELAEQFAEGDPKAEQVYFQFVGHDDEFAVARIKVKVTDSGEEGFLDNVVDTLAIFHQENGAWKLWDIYLLGATYTE